VVKDHQEEWQVLCEQAAREQDPARLTKLIQRICELLDAKQNRLQGKPPMPKDGTAIFQIAYTEMLLITRAELLKARGYEVVSVLGNDDAKRVLSNRQTDYRVFIVGHAASVEDRKEIVTWIKTNFVSAKVIALNPPRQDNLAGADFNFVLNGPEGWLGAVGSVAD
jgi:Icc-related predicted phosphoesterase